MNNKLSYYSPTEEKLNVLTHGFGILLSIIALMVLIFRAYHYGTPWHLWTFITFGSSLVVMYLASTIYHSVQEPVLRYKLSVVDHAAIYFLIAGSYTPFTLITLSGTVGWVLFGVIWIMAVLGMIFKLFFTGRYELFSTLLYVFMGWLAIFAIQPLMEQLAFNGLMWLLAGGISYTIGAVFFSIEKIKFNHAIFHVFVLGGSFCHFMAVCFYV